jgi:hypothetical protein
LGGGCCQAANRQALLATPRSRDPNFTYHSRVAHQGDTTKLMDDITALRPTLFIGVPRIFERIESGVMGQVARGGGWPGWRPALGRGP